MGQVSVRRVLPAGLRSRYCREEGCPEEVSGPALHGRVGGALGNGCHNRLDLGLRSFVCSCKEQLLSPQELCRLQHVPIAGHSRQGVL